MDICCLGVSSRIRMRREDSESEEKEERDFLMIASTFKKMFWTVKYKYSNLSHPTLLPCAYLTRGGGVHPVYWQCVPTIFFECLSAWLLPCSFMSERFWVRVLICASGFHTCCGRSVCFMPRDLDWEHRTSFDYLVTVASTSQASANAIAFLLCKCCLCSSWVGVVSVSSLPW